MYGAETAMSCVCLEERWFWGLHYYKGGFFSRLLINSFCKEAITINPKMRVPIKLSLGQMKKRKIKLKNLIV